MAITSPETSPEGKREGQGEFQEEINKLYIVCHVVFILAHTQYNKFFFHSSFRLVILLYAYKKSTVRSSL